MRMRAPGPLSNPKPLYKNSAWNEDMAKKKTNLRKSWNLAGKKGADQDKNKAEHRALLKEYKKAQEMLKEKCKVKFFEEADSVPAYARIHRILAKDPNAQVGSLLKPDGNYTVNSRETALHLLETHFPFQLVANHSTTRCQVPSRKDKDKWAIHKFYSFKSAGMDKIFPAMLKESIDLHLRRLGSIFKSSIALGYIPGLWEKVRVLFIPKPGRTTHSEAKDFRPISLTSFLLRTVERLLDFYIRGEVLKKFPLHVNQHAYQTGKSTDTALHQMIRKIESMLSNGKVALGCFMDIEGAFDNTDFEVITKAAVSRQVENVATRWIVKMLSGRTVAATICGTSTKFGVTKGCPQGGILHGAWCMVHGAWL